MISLYESTQGRAMLPKLAVSWFCWEGSAGTRTSLRVKGWVGSTHGAPHLFLQCHFIKLWREKTPCLKRKLVVLWESVGERVLKLGYVRLGWVSSMQFNFMWSGLSSPFLHYRVLRQPLMQFSGPKTLCKITLSNYPALEEMHWGIIFILSVV